MYHRSYYSNSRGYTSTIGLITLGYTSTIGLITLTVEDIQVP